ncbi:P-type conjugative transfer protein TrbJ [Metapseudomonas furukawaii]|uniref:P-type conjugative transfer protein TrbJ n=1 Tax=Metapseudomonas furukawaii TaxID=1149133 RepID=UPI0040459127
MKILAAKTFGLTVVMICALSAPLGHAGIPVIDGTNLSQNVMTAMESVAQTLKQIEQYQTQLQQYENQLQNTAAPAAYIWDQASRTINKLIEAQDMLAYYQRQAGSLDAYLTKYQDVAYYRSSPCFNGGGCSAAEKAALEENRRLASVSQKQANEALFKGLAQQQANMVADARQLERLQTAASTADGQVKAIQYANQIASQQANQLLQIRGLMIAQQSAAANKAAADLDAESRGQARAQQLRTWSYQRSPADDF